MIEKQIKKQDVPVNFCSLSDLELNNVALKKISETKKIVFINNPRLLTEEEKGELSDIVTELDSRLRHMYSDPLSKASRVYGDMTHLFYTIKRVLEQNSENRCGIIYYRLMERYLKLGEEGKLTDRRRTILVEKTEYYRQLFAKR